MTRRTKTGSWGLPGGHIDPGETEEVTAAREVVEETGLEVRAVGKVAQTEDDFVVPGQYAKYYNTHFIWCEVKDAAAQPEVSSLFPSSPVGTRVTRSTSSTRTDNEFDVVLTV